MDFVTTDILSGLPVAADNFKYILVICDHFTKWVEAYALPDQEASTCMRAVYDGFFSRIGYPLQIHTDQGRNFESALFKEMCVLTGVSKSRTTRFHPRSDGLTERANRTLLQMLRVTCEGDLAGWLSKLSTVLSAYRATQHKATGITPNMAMLGRETMLSCTLIAAPPDNSTAVTVPFVERHIDNLRAAHALAREHLHAYAVTQKRYFDARVKPVLYHVGQKVWLYRPRPLVRQRHRKLFNQWVGPFTILSFLTPITALVRCNTTHKRQRVHVDRLSPCAVEVESATQAEPQSAPPILSSGDAAHSSPSVTSTRTGRAKRTPTRFTL